jgi:ADP-ribose pyrophosphatase YjhB (NUDIX family)
MTISIFFNEKPVYLCDALDESLNKLLQHRNAVLVEECSIAAINNLLEQINTTNCTAGVLCYPNFDQLKELFFQQFTPITACGGVVQNDKRELLFIYRRSKWDLPKGKLEIGETEEYCAQREIEEETGVTGLNLKKKIGETYHTYHEFGKHFLKTTHWFYFTCSSQQKVQPQTEEDITEIKWVPTQNIREPMSNTYENIREVMQRFFDQP